MKDKLTQYIDLLFAGSENAEDIKQEILQNTLDRYEDLISQGKSPESAYSLSISGIGDIQELLNGGPKTPSAPVPAGKPEKKKGNPILTAIAIALFILCPIPVILLGDVLGVCLLFLMIAAGVALLIMNSSSDTQEKKDSVPLSPLHKTLLGIAWGCGITFYLAFSFITGAWYITWLVFPITACVSSLINAIFDLNKVFLSAVIRIVIFVILIAVLTVCLLGGYLGVNLASYIKGEYSSVDGTLSSSGIASAQQVKDIQVEWVSGSITVQPGQTQDIQFSEVGATTEDSKMIWKVSGERLIIQFSKPQFGISFFGTNTVFSKDLVITVPEDWFCDELEIDTVSAGIEVSGLQIREADLVNVSGNCSFTDCVIGDLSAETVSGAVNYTGEVDSLEMNTVSANCKADILNCPNRIELECVSGDLILTLPENCGFKLDLDTVSGEFSSDYPTKIENNRYIFGDGMCSISAESVSGDVLVKSPQ